MSQSLDGSSVSLQAPGHGADDGRMTNSIDDSWLSAPSPATCGLAVADSVTLAQSSVINTQSHNNNSETAGRRQEAANSAQSDSLAAAVTDDVTSSVTPRNITPGNTLSSDSKTSASLTSSRAVDDDIFADSSLFATC